MDIQGALPAEALNTLHNIYYLVGFGIVLGFGSLVSGLIFIIKWLIWIAQLDFRLKILEKDVDEAFKGLRNLRGSGSGGGSSAEPKA